MTNPQEVERAMEWYRKNYKKSDTVEYPHVRSDWRFDTVTKVLAAFRAHASTEEASCSKHHVRVLNCTRCEEVNGAQPAEARKNWDVANRLGEVEVEDVLNLCFEQEITPKKAFEAILMRVAGNEPALPAAQTGEAKPVQPWTSRAYDAILAFDGDDTKENWCAIVQQYAPSSLNVDEVAKELTMNLINRIPDVHAIYLDAILREVKWVLEKYAKAEPSPGLQQKLREEWLNNHGCKSIAQYRDDGEMQCAQCAADFKRMDFVELEKHVNDLRWRVLSQAAPSSSATPNPCPHNSVERAIWNEGYFASTRADLKESSSACEYESAEEFMIRIGAATGDQIEMSPMWQATCRAANRYADERKTK